MARARPARVGSNPGVGSTPESGSTEAALHRRRRSAASGRLSLGTFVLALAVAAVLLAPGAARAAGCQQSGPSASYTVNVCFTSPADGATLTGASTVTATVSVTGTNPGVRRMAFFLDGAYLLTDYQSPYTFTIPSDRFVDGVKTLEAEAWMRDGFISQRASIALTFANGVNSPPTNTNTFTPTVGTPPSGPFVVAAAGDGAGGEQSEADTTNLIASWSPNLFLYLGDVYEKGTATEFYNWFGPASGTFYGRFRPITDPTIGNHEYENGVAPGYFDYWDNVPHYYSFNANGWHLISLDANSAYNQTAPGTPQYDWLVNDLQANTRPCVLAYWHQPLFNIGQEPPATNMAGIWSLLAQHGVDLVVNGHDHTYQRWLPLDGSGNPDANGITELVAGTGGHALGTFVTTDSRVAASATEFGALRLVLNSAGASYQFINNQGQALDSGSVGCNGGAADTSPPTTPGGLTATGSYKTTIDLAWTASSDNVGVTNYEIYRDGQSLATIAQQASYADNSVVPGSTHSYQLRALDAAGNRSGFSNSATATAPTVSVLFHDGFESGDLSSWTQNSGLAVQQTQVFAGTNAAEAISNGGPTGASAYKQLAQNETDVYYVTRFKVLSQTQNVNLLRFRNSTMGANSVATLFITTTNKLGLRNDVAAVSTTSTTVAARGAWHTVQVHVFVNGISSQTEVWLDGTQVQDLTQSGINLGTNPLGRLELGDSSASRTFDVAFDEVAYDRAFVGDLTAPTTPGGLTATGVYKLQIDLAWTASADDVGITGYEIWRDGAMLTTTGPQPAYSDAAVAPGSTHTYRVRARDAAGNLSAFSASASATTPASGLLFHDGFETGDLSKWTSVNGLVVQQQELFTGSWGARATGTNNASFATKVLSNGESDLYAQLHFKVLNPATNVNLLRFRSTANASLLTAFVSGTARIGYRNEVTGVSTTSTVAAPHGTWHTLQVHVLIGASTDQTEVWLDGTKIAGLSNTEDLGTSPIGRLELGDNSTTHTYDVALDDVDYDRAFMSDSTPPTDPTKLTATARSGFEIDLSWTAPTDDTGISGYDIYRGGSLVDTAPGDATSYADTTVSPLTSYAYRIRAKDAAGNSSGFSNSAFATSGDAFAENFESGNLSAWTSVAGLTVQQAVVDSGQWAARATSDGTAGAAAQVQLDRPAGELYYRARFRVETQGSTNSVSLLRFRTTQNGALASALVAASGKLAYRNDSTGTVTTSGQTVSRGTWHEIQMHLLAGGTSSQVDVWLDGVKVITLADSLTSGQIGLLELGDPSIGRTFDVAFDNLVADPTFVADTATPTTPQNLRSTTITSSQIDLAWDQASDDVGVTTYRIYRNGTPVADVDGATLAYSDTGLRSGTQYRYIATALDAVGHESAAGNALVVTTVARPNKPTGLTATAVSGQNAVNLSWTPPVGGAAVAGYRIYRDSALIGTVNGAATTTYADTTVAPVTAYSYTVTAVDGSGGESDPSDVALVTTSDTVKPAAPAGLSATAVGATRVDLSWTAATDNVAVTGYRIYRNGSATALATVGGSSTSYSDSAVAPTTAYSYTVTALDGAGNESTPSNSATATTGPGTLTFAPSDDTYVRADKATSNFGRDTTLYADNSPVKHMLLKFSVSGIGAGTVQSAKLRLYCVDPSAVGGSVYRLADPNASWNEATATWNNAPAAASTPLASLGRVVANTWYEVDVTPLVTGDGSVSVRVTSTSADGAHYSSKEGTAGFAPQLVVTVGAAVPDSTPPSNPTNLHVVTTSPNQVDLAWTASTDNVRVAHYRVFRNGALLTTTGAVTSYSDANVSPVTHYDYTVQALDAAGNASGLSNVASVDTPAPAPVVTFTPTDDTYVRADNAATNFGRDTTLYADNSPVKHMLLRFSINGIGSRKVTSAKLRLYCIDPSPIGGDFHRLTDPMAAWSEGSVNWNTAPAADPAIAASLGRVVANTWYEVDVTPLVGGDGTLNLRATSTSADGAHYASKESTGGLAPQLVVTLAG